MSRNTFSPSYEQASSVQPILGSSPYVTGLDSEMQMVERLIAEIAPTDIPVLLVGESGTGKEVVALHIHELSAYRELPFVKLICATFTSEFVLTQLERLRNESSEKNEKFLGTLFFDEISELDPSCQRNLLHCIPDGNGISTYPSLQGRLVSCTTQDLEAEVQSGRFRSELFYRLNHICLKLPPLRRRKDDIPLLIQFFLDKYSRSFHRQLMNLSEKTIQRLIDYPWPGNIRQLENVVKKIVALENEELGVADLEMRPADSQTVARDGIFKSLKATSRAASQVAERQLILQALERTHWNRKRAAEALQISYKALLYKLKQIQVPDSERL
jgi:two-component system response regulator AtoC